LYVLLCGLSGEAHLSYVASAKKEAKSEALAKFTRRFVWGADSPKM